MVILDLTIFSIQKVGGISVVWAEYLKRLHKNRCQLDFQLVCPENSNQIAAEINFSPYGNISVVQPRGKISKYFPFLLIGTKTDLIHTSYYQWYPFFRGTKIVTLHDFMHEKFAPLKARLLHNILKYLSLNSADVILCISESTRNDFKEIYPRIYDRKDVRVVENAAGDDFFPDERNSRNDAFLWVAGRSGYKNFNYALKILSYLKSQGQTHEIFVVGGALTQNEEAYAKSLGVLDLVSVFSDVSIDELRAMYSSAKALLYLSKYEGFGLPILEAQKCRCPVVALENPASLEVARDSVLYISDEAESQILDILDVVSDVDLRAKIVERGVTNSNRYDWDSSLDKLVSIYQEYQT